MTAMGVTGISRAITLTNIKNRTHIQCNATVKMSKSALRVLSRLTKYHRDADDSVSVASILRKSPSLSKDSSLALLHSLILYDDCHLALSPSMPNGLDKSKSIKDSLLTSGSGSSEDISCIEDPQSDRKNSSIVQDSSNISVNNKAFAYDKVPNLGVATQNVADPTDLNWKEYKSIQSRHQNLPRLVNTQMEYASKSCKDDTYEYDSGHENCSV